MSIINIIVFATKTGKEPFSVWLNKLNTQTQAIIMTRLDRVSLGNFGDIKRIKNAKDVFEIRIHYGPGYRIYFGKEKDSIVLLLTGEAKQSQNRDIKKAKQYWQEYKNSI